MMKEIGRVAFGIGVAVDGLSVAQFACFVKPIEGDCP